MIVNIGIGIFTFYFLLFYIFFYFFFIFIFNDWDLKLFFTILNLNHSYQLHKVTYVPDLNLVRWSEQPGTMAISL